MSNRRNGELSVSKLVQEFLVHLQNAGYAPASVRTRRNQLERLARWCEANRVDDVRRVELGVLERFAQYLGRGGPLKKKSWTHIMVNLRAFYRWLVQSGYVDHNPVDELVRKLFPKESVTSEIDPDSFEGLIEAYLEHLRPLRRSKGFMSRSRTHLFRFSAWCAERGCTQPNDVDLAAIEAYAAVAAVWQVPLNRASESGAHSRRASAIYALRGFYRWLVKTDRATNNPAKAIEIKKQRRTRQALSESEMEHILCALDTSDPRELRMRAVLEMLYSTGMRLGELLALELRNIDRSRGLVLIRKGKGGKPRVVPIGNRALHWLDQYLEKVRPALAAYEPNGLDSGHVFLNRFGHPLRSATIEKTLEVLQKRVNSRLELSAHVVRHTTATVMLEHGADLRVIQELLGHQDLNSTQIYTHTNIQALTDVHRRTHPAQRARRRRR